MLTFVPLLGFSAAILFALLLDRLLPQTASRPLRFLLAVLPFAAGGFYTYTALLTLPMLLLSLRGRKLTLVWNRNSAAILTLILFYCLTPLWAADKGTAPFGIIRFLPLFPAVLLLSQLTPEEKRSILAVLPFAGAFMTVLSCLCLLIPGAETYLTVNGRLAGFLQYPNTFAAFLIAGLILLSDKPAYSRLDYVLSLVLITGILLSGSKTGLALLALTLIYILLTHRRRKLLPVLGIFLLLSAGLALLLSRSNVLHNTDRFLSNAETVDSFLLRFIYWKDALKVIVTAPFGWGFGSYRATLGSFQTANYAVTYIHNGLLQLLFEIGWIPSVLLFFALLRTLLTKKTPRTERFLLLVLLLHSLLDFNLQFSLYWLLILTCLDFQTGKRISLRRVTAPVFAILLTLTLWLGTGDLCFRLGKTDLSLQITPFHTEALTSRLQTVSDPEAVNQTADKLLSLNPTHSLAHSAKANHSLSQGDILSMISSKESAIRCNPYAIEEYTDYFDKLYAVSQLYLNAGDKTSASYCLQRLFSIPEMVESVNNSSDPVMQKIHGGFTLSLPDKYLTTLDTLSQGITTVLPELGHIHSYNSWNTVSMATCVSPGQQIRSCSCGIVQNKPYDALGHTYSGGICTRCADPEPGCAASQTAPLHRIFGFDRFGASYLTANQLKNLWNTEKFDTVILVDGYTSDALAAAYLSTTQKAPILFINPLYAARTCEYLNKHLAPNAMVYVLGDPSTLPDSILSNLTVPATARRLTGNDLSQLNLAVLSEIAAEIDDILIAPAETSPETVSAAATGLPVLFAGNTLLPAQQEILKNSTGEIYLVGAAEIFREEVELITGKTAHCLSGCEDIASTFFPNASSAVLGHSQDLPTALCAVTLSAAAKAPMLFEDFTDSHFLKDASLSSLYVLGNPTLISDEIASSLLPIMVNTY